MDFCCMNYPFSFLSFPPDGLGLFQFCAIINGYLMNMVPCGHMEKFFLGRASQLSNGCSYILIPLIIQEDDLTYCYPEDCLLSLAKSRLCSS